MLRPVLRGRHCSNVWQRSASHLAAAHSSWFKLEDQGMKDYELLARGSGFFVRGPRTGAMIALVSGHVAAPHRFRRYFPQEWLQHVRDADCQSVLETRSADGKIVTGSIARQGLCSGFRHASLDVAAFVVDERAVLEQGDTKVLTLDVEAGQSGLEVVVAGFRLCGESGSGREGVVATETAGEVGEMGRGRGLVDTGAVETEMGMCGGPVVVAGERERCVGMLEGVVVAEGEVARRVAGQSVFICAGEVWEFVREVEMEHGDG